MYKQYQVLTVWALLKLIAVKFLNIRKIFWFVSSILKPLGYTPLLFKPLYKDMRSHTQRSHMCKLSADFLTSGVLTEM